MKEFHTTNRMLHSNTLAGQFSIFDLLGIGQARIGICFGLSRFLMGYMNMLGTAVILMNTQESKINQGMGIFEPVLFGVKHRFQQGIIVLASGRCGPQKYDLFMRR